MLKSFASGREVADGGKADEMMVRIWQIRWYKDDLISIECLSVSSEIVADPESEVLSYPAVE